MSTSVAAHLVSPPAPRREELAWSRTALSGRLVEISGHGSPSPITAALGLVLDAQGQGETTAWITAEESSFFPPDAAEGGVDLDALAVIRVPALARAPRAADKLIRSGAFGLVVLDLSSPQARGDVDAEIRAETLSRLLGLARRHDTAVVLLTTKRGDAPSLGSLVSLRGEARRTAAPLAPIRRRSPEGGRGRRRQLLPSPTVTAEGDRGGGDETYSVEIRILKDKCRAPGWTHGELCRGPVGLR
jgi:recombination protein RecA